MDLLLVKASEVDQKSWESFHLRSEQKRLDGDHEINGFFVGEMVGAGMVSFTANA